MKQRSFSNLSPGPAALAAMLGLSAYLVSFGCSTTRSFDSGSAGAGNEAGNEVSDGAVDSGGAGGSSSTADTPAGGGSSAGTGAAGMGATSGSEQGGTPASGGGGGSGSGSGLSSLGTACERNGECDSDHCVNGVCCDGACNDTCERCGGDGHCEMAEDDEACGEIACPASTDCLQYPPKLTEDRCLSRGACKAPEDCAATRAPLRTACGPDIKHTICDGEGNCVAPTVGCQNISNCPVSSDGICCGHYANGSGYAMCNISPASCVPAPAQGTIPVECDQTLDCALGTICCYSIYKYGSSVRCVAADECTSDQSTLARKLCRPNDPAPVCPLGTTCTPAEDTLEHYMSSFYYCK